MKLTYNTGTSFTKLRLFFHHCVRCCVRVR